MRSKTLIQRLRESEPEAHPPTEEEVGFMLGHLRRHKVNPVIIGGAAASHYAKPEIWNGRKVKDLDVFVSRTPPLPPKDWDIDREAPGITSWVSPSGGKVDFMTAGYEFPGGWERAPRRVAANQRMGVPVAAFADLFRMKLNSLRHNDLNDLIAMVRSAGRVPTEDELGKLNSRQRENLELVRLWYQEKPTGKYGE